MYISKFVNVYIQRQGPFVSLVPSVYISDPRLRLEGGGSDWPATWTSWQAPAIVPSPCCHGAPSCVGVGVDVCVGIILCACVEEEVQVFQTQGASCLKMRRPPLPLSPLSACQQWLVLDVACTAPRPRQASPPSDRPCPNKPKPCTLPTSSTRQSHACELHSAHAAFHSYRIHPFTPVF